MFPILIDLGTHELPFLGETHLFLPTYGLVFALSVVLAWLWFNRRAKTLGVSDESLFNLTFYSLIAGIVGAKLLLILVDWRLYLRNPLEILGTLRSAGVLMGGVLAAAITFTLYCRRHGLPLYALGDAVAAPLALAHGIGRLGCFGAGCCWGLPLRHDHPLAITFTNPAAGMQTGVPLNVPRVPTQLIQAGHDLLLALALTVLWRLRLRPQGTVFWLYVLLYSLGRGIIEFWRGDTNRGLYFAGHLSTSQLLALALIVLAATMLMRDRLRLRRTNSS